MSDEGTTQQPDKPKRLHRATYATDKRKGGYLIRVQGPHAERFVGREVPVTTRRGDENTEKLMRLIWAGKDKDTGEPVALYAFEPRPRGDTEQVEF